MNITRGVIVSSSGFSKIALEFAESRPIELLDKDKLRDLLQKASEPDKS